MCEPNKPILTESYAYNRARLSPCSHMAEQPCPVCVSMQLTPNATEKLDPWSQMFFNFWDRVNQVKTESGCMEWTGSAVPQGYGVLHLPIIESREPRKEYSHRISWWLHKGLISKGMWVLHHCDNPKCVNPEHLYLGDAKQNAKDRDDRGRSNHPKGENVGAALLTKEKVIVIRHAYSNGSTSKELAQLYGVSHATIYSAATGQSWKHVGQPCSKKRQASRVCLTEKQALLIAIAKKCGARAIDLAKLYGCSRGVVHRIWNGKWKRARSA